MKNLDGSIFVGQEGMKIYQLILIGLQIFFYGNS